MLVVGRWHRKYTRDDGDLVRLFCVPALEDVERYDRLTGYFNAAALALVRPRHRGAGSQPRPHASRVDCTLPQAEIEVVERGAALRERVEPPSRRAAAGGARSGRRRHAGVVAGVDGGARPSRREGRGGVRRRAPADSGGRHLPGEGRHRGGPGGRPTRVERQPQRDRGRLAPQLGEHQRLHELGPEPRRVDDEEANFGRIWADKAERVIVLDTPAAVRRDLMRFMPDSDLPVRLRNVADPQPGFPVVPAPEGGGPGDELERAGVSAVLRGRRGAEFVTPMPSSGWRACSARRSGSSDRCRRPMPGGSPGCRPFGPIACSARCATRQHFSAVSSKRRSGARRWPSCGRTRRSAYRALRTRINLFESVVGSLQPILVRLPSTIAGVVLSGGGRRGDGTGRPAGTREAVPDAGGRADVVEAIERQVREARSGAQPPGRAPYPGAETGCGVQPSTVPGSAGVSQVAYDWTVWDGSGPTSNGSVRRGWNRGRTRRSLT